MQDDSRKGAARQGAVSGPDTIEARMRTRIRETIEAIVDEELAAALGVEKSARVGAARHGYRHGTRERTLTTSLVPTTSTMPRARVAAPNGGATAWRSTTVARYRRRTARVDEALLGVYLAGTNRRRLKGAVAPLLRGGPSPKMRSRAWWAACATTSRRGAAGTWPRKISALSFSTAASRRSGSRAGRSACPC